MRSLAGVCQVKKITGKAPEEIQAIPRLMDALREQLTFARQSLPSSRCLPHAKLVELVQLAKSKVDSPVLRRFSAVQLIRLLQDGGIVKSIPLHQGVSAKVVRLYAVGFEPTDLAIPSAELLQAHMPEGVLCYFSAIELHELSTQPAPHYHIAQLRRASAKAEERVIGRSSVDRPLPLGTLEFSYGGVGHYVTRRDSTNLRSFQRRQLSPYCVVRVATIEQTLLDCLHRPHSVGGAAVVFEAWESAVKRALPEKIFDLANQIGDREMIRRAGYMLERFFPNTGAVERARQAVGPCLDEVLPSLLPGIPFSRINKAWGLRTPQGYE